MTTDTRYDLFQVWLIDMDDALDRFGKSLPSDLAERLDFSPESLDALEEYILAHYPSPDAFRANEEKHALDGMARYVGEVLRKNLGGRWMIDYSDEKNVFYGLPQLTKMPGQIVQTCPMTLVTASADRRTGTFIRTVFENKLRNAQKAELQS